MKEKRKHPEIGCLGLGILAVGIAGLFIEPGAVVYAAIGLGAVVLVYALFTGNVKLFG